MAKYEKMITFDEANLDRRLINPKYHYRVAKLNDLERNAAKAIAVYTKFLGIWDGADKDQQDLIDATIKLAKPTGKRNK
jgi:hypothetical protein